MIHGFINLYKPLSWSSHDCVARMRRLLNTKKVGHGGTLDPLATGVLPIAVGRATRLLQYLPTSKAYRAQIRFGLTTTTDDLEGNIVTQTPAAHLTQQTVEAVLPKFQGTLNQIPPMYSAIQVDGKRLYELARQGKTIDVPMRKVEIYALESQRWQPGEQPELTLNVDCGGGTYIRSLARDLGEALGTGATLAGLVRTRSSGFNVTESLSLEEIATALENKRFESIPAGDALQQLKAIALPPPLARRWQLGQKLAATEVTDYLTPATANIELRSPIRVLLAGPQTFLGIGEFRNGLPTGAAESDSAAIEAPSPESTTVFAPKRVFLPL